MRILKARYADGDEFLRSYQLSFAYGGLFIPTRQVIPIGEPVVVSVQVGKRQSPLLLRGQVAWRRRGKHREKIRAGMAIEFLASERKKRDFLLAAARGESPKAVIRRHPRLPVDLPVSWRANGATEDLPGILRDIGRGGAFVSAGQGAAMPLPQAPHGSDVVLNLAAPGAEVATPYAGRIAWVGQNEGETGFGLTWRSRDTGGARRIRELVRRLGS